MPQGLLQLQLQSNAIRSSSGGDGGAPTTIIQGLCEGVSATAYTPAPLSAVLTHGSPAWQEAVKGIFLDLRSPAASSDAVVDLGEVCGSAFLAAARIKLCWMAPTHSSSVAALPRHIQFLLVELSKGGPYAVFLPLLPNNSKATLQPARQQPASGNRLAVHLDSGNPDFQHSSWQAAVYVAAGHDPFQLCDVAVAAAACVAGCARPRWEKQLPEVCGYLGWCTWDAFYCDVCSQGITAGLASFKRAGVMPRWLIIDDGWQRTGLDSTARSLARQLGQGSSAPGSLSHVQQHLQAVRRAVRVLWKRLLRTSFGWLHRRYCWPLLAAALRSPLLAGLASWLLQAYNRAISEHSKRLLSSHQFNAKFSGVYARSQADTSTAANSAQVLAFVSHIKQQYGLKHVFAWHATMGYWSGMSPEAASVDAAAAGDAAAAAGSSATAGATSSLARAAVAAEVVLPRASPVMSDLEPPTNWSQLVLAGIGAPQNPRAFYFHLHAQLAALGITGVKVDVQNQLELVGSAAGQQGGQALAEAWHAALEDSVAKHFPGNALINCMCHNTGDLYRVRDSCLARVSDDFYPRLPASHTTHVAVCAFNSLFFAPIVQPDWDMFHSLHPRGLLHATARMISGGPVYVSDKPGAHDPSLLARLALPGGVLLQPLLPGRPCRDTLFADVCGDGVSALKVWNRNACGGMLALFNVQGSNWSRSAFSFVTHTRHPPAVTASVQPGDVWGLSCCMQQGSSAPTTPGSALDAHHQQQQQWTGQRQAAGSSLLAAGIQLGGGLSATGQYAVYCDRSGGLTVVQGLLVPQGLSVQLGPAESEVVTVAPVLHVTGATSSSSSSTSGVTCAVVGLVNMLNPGGAVRSIRAGSQQQQQPARSSDGSNNGSSTVDSGSWVMAAAGSAADATAAGTSSSPAPDAAVGAVAGADKPALHVQFMGCGELLLHSAVQPQVVLLDGEAVGFSFDSASSRLVVVVPISDSLEHALLVQWP